MTQRITMEDIARQSGVSLATVSLVLRDKPGINDETRRRVLDIARDLGYRKRLNHEKLVSQSLHNAGVIVKASIGDDSPLTNPFYAPIVAGIEAACRKMHINLMYATVPVDMDNHPQEMPRLLSEDHLDGVLLVGAFADATITKLLQREGIPAVLVDGYAHEHVYDSVVSDNFRAAYEAVSYLISYGHRHIGLIGTTKEAYPSIAERRKGYIQALTDHGIHDQYFGDCLLTMHEGSDTSSILLQRHPQITALFCANDIMAIGATQAARALHRQIPQDLSIIGFDNIDLAQHVAPALTTMHVDKVSMGRFAVQLLANRAEYPDQAPATVSLRPRLLERQSVQRLQPPK